MKMVPYIMLKGSLNSAMLYIRLNIYFTVGMEAKHILKYLKRMGDYMLVHQSENLIVTSYTTMTCSLIVIMKFDFRICVHSRW